MSSRDESEGPLRLSEISLGESSSHDSPGEDSGSFDLDELAREDAGGRVMSALSDRDTKKFISAMRDLMAFMKD